MCPECFDLIVAADPAIDAAAEEFHRHGAQVGAVEVDLSTRAGVGELYSAMSERPSMRCWGTDSARPSSTRTSMRSNTSSARTSGTIYLIHLIGAQMRARGAGRILITGSIAGFMPATFHTVYNASKAFIDSFSFALRAELKDSGVTVTCPHAGSNGH